MMTNHRTKLANETAKIAKVAGKKKYKGGQKMSRGQKWKKLAYMAKLAKKKGPKISLQLPHNTTMDSLTGLPGVVGVGGHFSLGKTHAHTFF